MFLKKRKVLALFIIMLFAASSCSAPKLVKVTPVSLLLNAVDEKLTHLVGKADENSWLSVQNEGSGMTVQGEKDKLEQGWYSFTATLLVEDNLLDMNIVSELRVEDADNKTPIVYKAIQRNDFDQAMSYQEFTVNFQIEKTANIKFGVFANGNSYLKVKQIRLVSISPQAYAENSAAKLFAETKEEQQLIFDDNVLYYIDLRALTNKCSSLKEQYDISALVTTVQGLVNREKPRLYIKFLNANDFSQDTDKYWLNRLSKDGNLLSNKTVVTLKSPYTLLRLFEGFYNGAVLYDEGVPATINAAFTAAGADNLIPFRYTSDYNSLYYEVIENRGMMKVKLDLNDKFTGKGKIWQTKTKSTGSKKNDVYIWAKEKYLDTNKASATIMGYYIDTYISQNDFTPDKTVIPFSEFISHRDVPNRDYYISNKAFIFDLSMWDDFAPMDDPKQRVGTDRKTMEKILAVQNKRAGDKVIHIGGFTPWVFKYTSRVDENAPDEVSSELELVRVMSMYNCINGGDAVSWSTMANASVFMHFKMEESYKQTASKEPKKTELENKNYLMFYMGDYDSSTWLNTAMIKNWNDKKRGVLPLAWPICPDISRRAGHVMDWMYKTATTNDYFVVGDNGLGYLNPFFFDDPRRPKGLNGSLETWKAQNLPILKKFDLDISGWLTTNYYADEENDYIFKKVYDTYSELTPKGIATNKLYKSIYNGVPTIQLYDLGVNLDIAYNAIKGRATIPAEPTFHYLRCVVTSPSQIVALVNRIKKEFPEYDFEVLDPYTFFYLYQKNGGKGGVR